MNDALLEPVLEALSVLVYAVVTVALTGLGLLTEQAGLSTIGTDQMLGLWLLAMGAVALGGAYLVATGRLLPRARALLA
ncbi:hypothetical protein ACFQPA_10220 [Halomarina halobia]|uniref:DUF8151 domain-containing protein n=1 Tax=Halomarina halobia TaxID=3033386 RepID=A0ABD6ABH8_9EURY|nr:hypothetical protein [Halomarina sp. PSR21]